MSDRSIAWSRLAPRIALWLALTLLAAAGLSSQAGAQPNGSAAAAEEFVRADLERGLAIVNDRSVPDSERRAKLRTFLRSFMDIRRVALFSLGLARRSATQEQTERFVNVFGEYAVAYFESLLTSYYSGQAVRVTGCDPEGSNTYRVNIVLDRPAHSAQNDDQAIDISVQAVGENGNFIITDIAAMGVWLGVQEREEVNNYLLQTHGNLGGLIVHYQSLAERKRGGLTNGT